MKIDYELCLMGIFILIVGVMVLFTVNGVEQSMEDRLVVKCISGGDITNSYQQELCLKIMESFDYDIKKDFRKDIYEILKEQHK